MVGLRRTGTKTTEPNNFGGGSWRLGWFGFDEKAPKLWNLTISRAVPGGSDGWASTNQSYLLEF